MYAVARNSSQDVLRAIDRLLVEGQSTQHFARQMLRFLRNALVAKVAGSDSPVLQISSDERARVARVAERFSEEDLSRFMQIMLRTHSDLGYKQEQRFHLELGLLKLVHAQRLLPLEELLSGEASKGGAASSGKSTAATARVGTPLRASQSTGRAAEIEAPSSRAPAASPFARPSPFEADRNRKSGPRSEAGFGVMDRTSPEMNASGGGAALGASMAASSGAATALAVEVDEAALPAGDISAGSVRNAVLAALEEAGQNMLAHNLETGEWSLRGNEVAAKVAMSQVLIDVALGAEPKRIIQAALAKVSATPLKFKMVGGGTATAIKPESSPRPANGAGARSRALNDPVVKRMQEKFGAEIRTVIDQKSSG